MEEEEPKFLLCLFFLYAFMWWCVSFWEEHALSNLAFYCDKKTLLLEGGRYPGRGSLGGWDSAGGEVCEDFQLGKEGLGIQTTPFLPTNMAGTGHLM